ncbi:MAG TPA: hypothetical protein VM204_02405 [Gaiellaceae bacterium]|nr:hypothetical protein [Gaiellaceae bacterium]
MTFDPHLAATMAMLMAVCWTMCFAGMKKHMLELKQRRRVCPSCGRTIHGRVCNSH